MSVLSWTPVRRELKLSSELKCHVFVILIRSLSSVVSSAPVQASPDEPADVSKASLSVKVLCCYLWAGGVNEQLGQREVPRVMLEIRYSDQSQCGKRLMRTKSVV